jgi:uncharacterized membrane protein YgcG
MRKYYFLSIISAALIIFCLFPSINRAQSEDLILVIDDARLFGDRLSDVEKTAKQLTAAGADVRVRTITSIGNAGNLDLYEEQLEKRSPSWTGQDGDRKNNLIVLIISSGDRISGLYYGAYWDTFLKDRWMNIQTQKMNPLFSSGDYAGGTITGLNEIIKLIQVTPAGTTSATVIVPTAAQTNQSTGAGWAVLIVVLVVVALLAGLVVFISLRKKQTEIKAARHKALLAKQAAAAGINELVQATQMLEIKVNVTTGKIAPEDAGNLTEGLEQAKKLVDQGSQKYSELAHSAGDPENPKLGRSELGALEPEYQKIVETLRQGRESVKNVENRIAAVQQTIDSVSSKVSELKSQIELVAAKQDQLKLSGYKTSYSNDLGEKARLSLQLAQNLFAQKRYNEGLQNLDQGTRQIQQAEQAVTDLPQKKQQAQAAIPILLSQIERVKETIIQGGNIFDRLSQEYAESSWEAVQGNGTEAENRVNWALQAADDARLAASEETQEWYKALELVEKGNTWLNEAQSLIKSISELEEKLKIARRDAPNEIEAARADISTAWEYINRYDDDIRESLEDDLHSAEQIVEAAREELKQSRPDYLKVCKMARQANESADKILIQARSEHESAERLRIKSVSSRRDAATRVSIARQYIEDHNPVVRPEARTQLMAAVDLLNQAEVSADINTQIMLASNAETTAERAYYSAQSDVRNTTVNVFVAPVTTPPVNRPPIFRPPAIPAPHSSSRPGPINWGSSRPGGSSSRPGGGSTGWSARTSSGGHKGGGSTGW